MAKILIRIWCRRASTAIGAVVSSAAATESRHTAARRVLHTAIYDFGVPPRLGDHTFTKHTNYPYRLGQNDRERIRRRKKRRLRLVTARKHKRTISMFLRQNRGVFVVCTPSGDDRTTRRAGETCDESVVEKRITCTRATPANNRRCYVYCIVSTGKSDHCCDENPRGNISSKALRGAPAGD